MSLISFRLEGQHYEAIQEIADQKGITLSKAVRDIVIQNLQLNDISNRLESVEKLLSDVNLPEALGNQKYSINWAIIAIEELARKQLRRSDYMAEYIEEVNKRLYLLKNS